MNLVGASALNRINQHYVWKSYLKQWTNGRTLHCLRDGKIFQPNPAKIACERYFYKSGELTPRDLELIEQLGIVKCRPGLQEIHRAWLQFFNTPFAYLREIRKKSQDEESLCKFEKWIQDNLQEQIHSQIEVSALPFLEALRGRDTRFFDDMERRISFLVFLCVQYLRTNKIRAGIMESAAKTLKERAGYDLERVWNPLCQIFAVNIADGLVRENVRLHLLENKSSTPFITGDQPVVNISATDLPRDTETPDVELYYPLTPELAIIITRDRERWHNESVPIDGKMAVALNRHIVWHARDELYSNSRTLLEEIRIARSSAFGHRSFQVDAPS